MDSEERDYFIKITEDIGEIKSRITRVETKVDNHLENEKNKTESNNRKFKVMMALMAVGFTVYEIFFS